MPKSNSRKPNPLSPDEIGKRLRDTLNRHGYPFQQAVATSITQNSSTFLSSWTPLALEFPVRAQNHDTRIDLVLTNASKTIYLVCECKRTNPALNLWCFARSSHISERFQYPRIDKLSRDNPSTIRPSIQHLTRGEPHPFHIALEVPNNDPGDANGKGRGQIEDAATQVLRGLNGLMNSFYERGMPRLGCDALFFLPVIITTAQLWCTESTLDDADLSNGDIKPARLKVKKQDWLWYDYPQSPGLKHSVPEVWTAADLDELLYDRFARTIAIVTPDGLDDFLSSAWWGNLPSEPK